jgi:hypothetical protein
MQAATVLRTAEGALGGALGTMFMQQTMQLQPRLPDAMKPPPIREDPGRFLTERLETARGRRFDPATHDALAGALHWAYGVGWGALLGTVAARRIRDWRSALGAGAALGALVWAVGHAGWLPAAGLMEPVHRQGVTRAASALGTHVAYGIIAAIPLAVFARRD